MQARALVSAALLIAAGTAACRRAPADDTAWVRDLVPRMQAPSFGRDAAIRFFGTAGAAIEGGVNVTPKDRRIAAVRVLFEHPAMKPCNHYLRIEVEPAAASPLQPAAVDQAVAAIPNMSRVNVAGTTMRLMKGAPQDVTSFSVIVEATRDVPPAARQIVFDRNDNCPGAVPEVSGEAEARAFLAKLNIAVAGDDRRAAAALVAYPLDAYFGRGRRLRITSASQFVARFDDLLSRRMKRGLADSAAHELFNNSQGYMIDDGAIWFNGRDGLPPDDSIRVSALNVRIGREDPGVATALTALQAATAADSREAVARVIAFPLRVRLGERERLVKTRTQFLDGYDATLTPALRRIISDATLDSATEINYGVAFGHDYNVVINATPSGAGVVELSVPPTRP